MTLYAEYPQPALEKILMEITKNSDVVAAFKTTSKAPVGVSKNEDFSSITNSFLFKLRKNPQAGALFFSKDVWETISFPSTDFIFSIEFLIRAQEAGFKLLKYDIYQTGGSSQGSKIFS